MQKKPTAQTYQKKWHRFWRDWHEAKTHFYGSGRHDKKRQYHEEKLNETIGNIDQQDIQQEHRTSVSPQSSV
ncbi:hypothetical protein BCL52_2227 [Salisediminibacterium halotolerans]|uniref:Uncharacterized protein n=1 Tax=Salisediminibacterium halotolerans TaxID=517425 RepID=A0A1H9TML5_9BACI|nr:hypothetical protein BCL39_2232 [Actinophytocola xinjiangensis]RPE85546.1 hypothetical protein EDD67_2367 [Salisediminibacterium halotolerans]TWG33501.1 hypothetical protein BCL52_2227 [Salisediminibacterium halotolerans]GEL08948.1 hypothetical protein SHA02_23640 [Salisediminibacterium halotolerans]SER98189.1 hypothetical protein SAMN05444126_11079 [Salisediminibacterium haloalkalitolerans]